MDKLPIKLPESMRPLEELIIFPLGVSNYEQLIKNGNYYVDKTSYIALLERLGSNFISFLRPRRIGKSLFVSTLEYYYGKEHHKKFETLFGQFYIGQYPTALANSFAVLKMDFSGIDTSTEQKTYQGFLEKVRSYIGFFNKVYKCFDAETLQVIQKQGTPEGTIQKFFEIYEGTPIYLIIDEYDHFTNEILIQDLKHFKRAVTLNGYVRKFYEVIKEATQQGAVHKVFVTGVSPVTLDSLTSGFNMIQHVSGELTLHDMMGFTEEDVSQIVDLILVDKSRKPKLMQDLKAWYNGYCFDKKSKHHIYNANMVTYFCEYFQRYQEYPEEMLDVNIAPDYGKLKKMFEIQNPAGNYELLRKVIYEQEVAYKLIAQFSFDKGFSDAQFISFLYYMGYLTISGEAKGLTTFVIPNLVIKELYWEYFSWLITQRENLPYEDSHIQQIVGEMTIGNIDPFLEMITEVFKKLSNRDYQNFDEKYIKVVMISFIALAEIYHIKSEPETTLGYIDMYLQAPPTSSIEHEFIFELKYLPKNKATPEKIAAKQSEAREQFLKYLQADPSLSQNPRLLAYTLIFVKNQMLVEQVEI